MTIRVNEEDFKFTVVSSRYNFLVINQARFQCFAYEIHDNEASFIDE
jgi:hypothetical protein